MLERLEADAKSFIEELTVEWRWLSVGEQKTDRILIMNVDAYSRHKSHLGVIDIIVVNNRYNMSRVDKAKPFAGIKKFVDTWRLKPQWIEIEPDDLPVELASNVPQSWQCGEAYKMKASAFPIYAQDEYIEPCGAHNLANTWYCRHCGRFRGLIY